MTEPLDVEILEPEARSAPSVLEVRGLVKIEEIRLERTKIRSLAIVAVFALLAWAAVCHATC